MIYEAVTIIFLIAGMAIVISSYYLDSNKRKEKKIQDKNKREEDYEEYGARIEELNKKILELNEYYEFMKGEMDSKHKELLFLYQIINDKSKEINNLEVKAKAEYKDQVVCEVNNDTAEAVLEEMIANQTEHKNSKKRIINLSEQGYSVKEIARMLDIGQGEVKLVLNLFK
jgi:chromosome segregation ATPase